jgi:hypothetical protein
MEKIGLSLVGIGAGDIVDGIPSPLHPSTQQTQAFKSLHECTIDTNHHISLIIIIIIIIIIMFVIIIIIIIIIIVNLFFF